MKKDRSSYEIILDVLEVTEDEKQATKTRIMQGAYLDWRNFGKYFNFLLEKNFIARRDPETNYELTEEGRELLKKLKEVSEILKLKNRI